MSVRVLESGCAHMVDAGQDLVDSIVSAVDTSRHFEVEQVHRALEALGLEGVFRDELRLLGVGSVCNGECWGDVLAGAA